MNPERAAQLKRKVEEMVRNGVDRAVIMDVGRRFKSKFSQEQQPQAEQQQEAQPEEIATDASQLNQYAANRAPGLFASKKVTEDVGDEVSAMMNLGKSVDEVESRDALVSRDAQKVREDYEALGIKERQFDDREGQQIMKAEGEKAGYGEYPSSFQAAQFGTATGVGDIGYGAKRLAGLGGRSEEEIEKINKIQSDNDVVQWGRALGQSLPFIPAGGAGGAVGGYIGRLAVMSGLGAAELGIASAGEGQKSSDVVKSAAIGGALGVVGEAAIPAVKYLYKKANKLATTKIGGKLFDEKGNITKRAIKSAEKQGITPEQYAEEILDQVPIEKAEGDRFYKQLVKATKKTKKGARAEEQLASSIADKIDPEVYKAAEQLGIKSDDVPLAVAAIQRGNLKDVAAELATKSGGVGAAKRTAFLEKLSNQARNIDDSPAPVSVDSESASLKVRDSLMDKHSKIKADESRLFDKIDKAVPTDTRVNPTSLRKYYNDKVKNYGRGDLPAHLNKLKKVLNIDKSEKFITSSGELTKLGREESAKKGLSAAAYKTSVIKKFIPTFQSIKDFKGEVGNAAFSKSGSFTDVDTRELMNLYHEGIIPQYQQIVGKPDSVLGTVLKQANKKTQERKSLEKTLEGAFGREFKEQPKNIVNQLTDGIANISGANTTKFNKAVKSLESLKSKEDMQEVARTSLTDLFFGGSGQKQAPGEMVNAKSIRNFYSAWVKDTPSIKKLKEILPPRSHKRIEALGKIAKALEGSDAPRTGAILRTDNNIKNAQGALTKILESAAKHSELVAGTAAGIVGGGVPGFAVGAAVGAMAKSSLKKVFESATPLSVDAMLNSPRFSNILKSIATGNKKSAESNAKAFTKSKTFKQWLRSQPPSAARGIANVGFIKWLTSGDDKND